MKILKLRLKNLNSRARVMGVDFFTHSRHSPGAAAICHHRPHRGGQVHPAGRDLLALYETPRLKSVSKSVAI